MAIFPLLELYQDEAPRSASLNMALDEIFWQTATTPRLRFYEWDHPALSFGYFGRYDEVAEYRSERDLVRRCTGGGIVLHGSDLTYALIIPAGEQLSEHSSMSIYGLVHAAIQRALRETGIVATLAEQPDRSRFSVLNASASSTQLRNSVAQPPSPGYGVPGRAQGAAASNACFANPVPADVLVRGQKVAGAAQRRSRRALLQQGSIQNIHLSEDFRQKFAQALAEKIIVSEIDSGLLDQAHRLADSKYQTEGWLRRR